MTQRLFFLIMLATVTLQSSTINSISPLIDTINVVTNYTWQITFSNSTPRINANLTFPSFCTLSLSTQVWVSGTTQLNTSISDNTVVITNSSLLFSFVSLTVTNVKNPYSAMSIYSFSVTTIEDNTFTLSQTNQVIYSSGSLQYSLWSFSLCTEQPSSNLTVTVTINNPIPEATTNYFYIGYGNWVNHYNKNLLYGVTSPLSGWYSLDNGVTYNPITTITYDTSKIIIIYPQTVNFTTGNTLKFIVSGVQSPPTKTTPTTSGYYVATADTNGKYIDFASSCTVSTTCVTNYTNAIFSNSNMPVNSNYPSPQIGISATPIITISSSDTVEMSFSPLSNFNNCGQLRIWRNIGSTMQASLTSSSTVAIYTIQSINTPNSDSSNNITLSLTCTSVTITNSETPIPLTFTFKRSSSQYMFITAYMKPQASLLPNNLTLVPSTTQMTKTAVTYTFSLLTAQPLGSSPALKLYFSTDIILPVSPTCTVALSTGTTNSPSCSRNSTNALTLNFTALTTISKSTTITVTVNGITNPATPILSNIGAQTYYDYSDSTSRVQYSFPGFSTTFTGITNYPATFLPASLTVFSLTSTTITLTNSVALPSGCTFYAQYPSQATNIAITGQPLTVNNLTNGNPPITNNNNSFSLTTTSDIVVNSTIVLSANLTSPPSMGSFNYVVLRIYSGSTLYIESSTSMFLYVNSVLSLPITITPDNPTTGALSAYKLILTLSVPHPASFQVQIDLPADVNYTGVGSNCTGNCSSVSASNSTSLTVTASNSMPNITSIQISLYLSATFTNARHIGTSLPWKITTKTISPSNTISFTSESPSLTTANQLSVNMLTDNYYINNTNTVKISFTFTNNLIAGDYIEMQFSTDTYSEYTTVSCSLSFGTCNKSTTSTSAILIVIITPNLTAVVNKTLTVWVQGMISGSNRFDYVNVSTYTSAIQMIDTGTMYYSLSCYDSSITTILNNCRTCYANHSCIDCYLTQGFYLNGSVCVSSCGVATSYVSYANNQSGSCQPCINNCLTCSTSTYCITCIPTYYLMDDNTCVATCSPNGYIISSTNNGLLLCKACYGGGSCLKCTSPTIGSCTICVSTSVLSNGICLSSCANDSMYASGGVCLPCDTSCSTCTSGSNGGCTRCAINYYNYTNFCLSACPTGTAPNSNSTCTCDSPCSKCQTSTTYCTACINSSLFVSAGQCLSSCPAMNYISGSTCYPCNTACTNCSATTCFSCLSTYYLYSNICYSDCKQIGSQFDVSGTSCVQCPDGCSTCKISVCTSCITNYTLQTSNSQCIQTCLLTNSCSLEGATVLPLPGLISVALWAVVVLVIKFIMQKNYLPYSLILFTGVVQLVLVIATIASSPDISSLSLARLLTPSNEERTTIRVLLGLSLAINYIANIIYLILFIKYIKPLVTNPRQIDVISHVVVLAVGTLTNYRFCLIAYAKLFPKPTIHIENSSKLTPIHILAIITIFLDILPISACIVGIYNQQAKTNLFMLSVDLLILIAINILVTIWFVSCNKPESYYEDDIKKYHMEDHHNSTDANLPNDRSKTNMVANDTFHFADEDLISNKLEKDSPSSNYKKLTSKVSKISVNGLPDNAIGQGLSDESDFQDMKEQSNIIPVRAANSKKANPNQDVNFEEGLKSKMSNSSASIPSKQRIQLGTTLKSQGKNSQDMLASKKHSSPPKNFSKDVASARKNYLRPERDIQEVLQQGDIAEMPEKNEGRESVFDRPKEKIARPKRVGTQKKAPVVKKQTSSIEVFNKEEGKKILRYAGTDKEENGREERRKSVDQPLKVMRKNEKVGYFQSDAFESNAEQDIETIIKQKVWQGTVKKDNKKFLDQQGHESNNSQTGYEQISPSWFNVQNQRIELSDFGDRQSEP